MTKKLFEDGDLAIDTVTRDGRVYRIYGDVTEPGMVACQLGPEAKSFHSNGSSRLLKLDKKSTEQWFEDGYKRRIADLEAALGLALCKLVIVEPPDSRAVSDEFVAMAAVHAGDDIVNDAARAIVKEGLRREHMISEQQSAHEIAISHVLDEDAKFIDVQYIRRVYQVSLMDAVAIGKYVESGVCETLDEAARYHYNRGLAIHIRPQKGETDGQAHDRWALARAKDGLPPLQTNPDPVVEFK